MDRVNEDYLTDIRNTIRVITARSEAKKQQLFLALVQNIRQSSENHQTKQEAIGKVNHVLVNLDNSGSVENLLLDYLPNDYAE